MGRQRETQRQKETEIQRYKETERDTKRQRETEREKERQKETERQRETQGDRERDTQRDRDRTDPDGVGSVGSGGGVMGQLGGGEVVQTGHWRAEGAGSNIVALPVVQLHRLKQDLHQGVEFQGIR